MGDFSSQFQISIPTTAAGFFFSLILPTLAAMLELNVFWDLLRKSY